MYKLLKPLQKGLDLMLSEFEKYIADTGLAKVKAFYTENVSIGLVLNTEHKSEYNSKSVGK